MTKDFTLSAEYQRGQLQVNWCVDQSMHVIIRTLSRMCSVHASCHPHPNYLKKIIQESLHQHKTSGKYIQLEMISGRARLCDKMPCGGLFENNPPISIKNCGATSSSKNTFSHYRKLETQKSSLPHQVRFYSRRVSDGSFSATQYSVWPSITGDNGRCLTEALNTTLKKGIKSPVFHQFNIPNISPSQADSTRLPKKTYGIQLKGSSFSKTVSFSLNFLRRSVWTCFR